MERKRHGGEEPRAVAVQPSLAKRTENRPAFRTNQELQGGPAEPRKLALIERLLPRAVEGRLEMLQRAPQASLRRDAREPRHGLRDALGPREHGLDEFGGKRPESDAQAPRLDGRQ